jgi:signal transduction histidine kinase/ActR/RegA family two-component response regulator
MESTRLPFRDGADRGARGLSVTSPFVTLTDLAHAVTSTLDLSEVLHRVIHAAMDLEPGFAAGMWVVEDAWLVLRAEAGLRDPDRTGRKTRLAFDEGLTGHVASTREPLVVYDVLADPRTLNVDWLRREEFVSAAFLPLLARRELVGVLTLLTRHRHRFAPAEMEVLSAFGAQAAIAVHNARLFADTDRRRQAAESLAAVARLISQSLDCGEVGARIAESIRALLNARASALYRIDPVSGDSVALAVAGEPGPAFGNHLIFPRGTGMTGLAASERRAVVTPNLLTDPRVTLTPDIRARIESAPYRAVLAIPLITQDKVIGTLGVGDRAGRPFSDEDIRLAQAFADQAAIVLHNTRLFDEQHRLLQTAQVRQARVEALLEVSRQLTRIQPLESLFTSIAETCARLLGAESVGIRLVDGEDLVVAGTWGDAKEVMATTRLKLGESLSGIVAVTGEAILSVDASHDVRLIPSHREMLARLGFIAMMVVPIKSGARIAGVLSLHTRQARGFSEDDLAIVTAFASQVAVALENNRLYERVHRAYDELTQTQQQLLQSQKMQAIGQLAGGIAHDFNNLMTVISARGQLLLGKLRQEDPVHREIELMTQAAERATDLTRQLLAFSRKQVLQMHVLQLNALVAELAPMLQRIIGENIRMATILDPALGRVRGDARQLEQVIMNLAINARDAMPHGGRLSLETANVKLDSTYAREHPGAQPGPHVMLAVVDTGTGMDAETQARLFEPFFTTKGPGKGTGLGLSTVYGIVKQSGGHIWVYSEPGRGTTFKVYLPQVEELPEAEETALSPADAFRGTETILVVEDEDGVRAVAREILTARGYRVLEAAHGAEALLLCGQRTERIHLLLTDVVMPEVSGPMLADRLALARSDMRVLFMSGYTDSAVIHDGVLEAGTPYLQKPFSPDSLAREVRRVLDAPRRPAQRRRIDNRISS